VFELNYEGYFAQPTVNSLELFPSTDSIASPRVYSDAFFSRFPFITDSNNNNNINNNNNNNNNNDPTKLFTDKARRDLLQFAVLATESLILIQKIVEQGEYRNIELMLQNALQQVDVPSVYGQLKLDSYGRIAPQDFVVLQTVHRLDNFIISPIGIASGSAILPVPSWNERSPDESRRNRYLSQRLVEAFTIALLLLQGIAIFLIALHHHSSPVLRASSPSLLITFVLGSMLMLGSNLAWRVEATTAGCQITPWLLSCGATLCCVPLLIRAYRICSILQAAGLRPGSAMSATRIAGVVAAALFVDLLINTLWLLLVPVYSQHISPDSYRPLYNYYVCTVGSSNNVFQQRIVISLLVCYNLSLLVAAVGYAFRGRKVPTVFNESTSLLHTMVILTTFSAVVVFVFFTLDLSPEQAYLFRTVAIVFGMLAANAFLVWYKFYLIFNQWRYSFAARVFAEEQFVTAQIPKTDPIGNKPRKERSGKPASLKPAAADAQKVNVNFLPTKPSHSARFVRVQHNNNLNNHSLQQYEAVGSSSNHSKTNPTTAFPRFGQDKPVSIQIVVRRGGNTVSNHVDEPTGTDNNNNNNSNNSNNNNNQTIFVSPGSPLLRPMQTARLWHDDSIVLPPPLWMTASQNHVVASTNSATSRSMVVGREQGCGQPEIHVSTVDVQTTSSQQSGAGLLDLSLRRFRSNETVLPSHRNDAAGITNNGTDPDKPVNTPTSEVCSESQPLEFPSCSHNAYSPR
jgi:hypothetical protein